MFPLADGLSASERAALVERLPLTLASRIMSAEVAAIGWLEMRLPEERDEFACTRNNIGAREPGLAPADRA